MNKQTYLDTLEAALRAKSVPEPEEILSEYEAHFSYKLQDGFSEEETAARLGDPEALAEAFAADLAESSPAEHRRADGRLPTKIGVIVLDVFAVPSFLLLFAWILAMGAVSVSLLAAAGFLVSGAALPALFPVFPLAGRILLGIALLSLSILAGTGTVWFYLFVLQLVKAYRRWHRNLFANRRDLPLPTTPVLSGAFRRRMRKTAQAALLVFVLTFLTAYIVLAVLAGSVEFWHHWGWFC